MKALYGKQWRLVCHPMTIAFLFFGVMLLIPSYPYTVVFFYVTLGLFFTMMNGREQRDADFTALLPVTKPQVVSANVLFAVTVELLSLLLAVPFAVLSVRINPLGGNAVGLDPNVALFAAGLVIYAVFNFLFYVNFYTTGYKVGISFLKATIPMAVVMLALEVLPHLPGLAWLNDTTLSGNLHQLPLLAVAAAIYGLSIPLTVRKAAQKYEKVDL